MKKSLIVPVVMLTMILTAGAVAGSGNERHEGREYEHGESKESKIYGTIQKLPRGMVGVWNVDGKEVVVAKETRIKERHGKAAEGALVEASGAYNGKTFNAYEIEVKKGK